jgi:hypothetical protein
MDINSPISNNFGSYSNYSYFITNFFLNIAANQYSGSTGAIYSKYYDYDSTPSICEFDTFDLVSDDSSLKWSVTASAPVFYKQDGTAYTTADDFLNLPDKIITNDLYCGMLYFTHLSFEQQQASPVPEPETFFVLGIGMIVAFFYRRKTR